jgi:hypothetical protein
MRYRVIECLFAEYLKQQKLEYVFFFFLFFFNVKFTLI